MVPGGHEPGPRETQIHPASICTSRQRGRYALDGLMDAQDGMSAGASMGVGGREEGREQRRLATSSSARSNRIWDSGLQGGVVWAG